MSNAPAQGSEEPGPRMQPSRARSSSLQHARRDRSGLQQNRSLRVLDRLLAPSPGPGGEGGAGGRAVTGVASLPFSSLRSRSTRVESRFGSFS